MKTPKDAITALKSIHLLAALPHSEIVRLAERAKREEYDVGAELISEGTSGSKAYFIEQGACDVRRRRGTSTRRINTLGPGEFFGELSILDPAPRTATVIAIEPTTVWVLSGYDFTTALKANKSMALTLVKVLAARLRVQEDEFRKS